VDRLSALWRTTLVRHTVLALVGVGVLFLAVGRLSDIHDNTWVAQTAIYTCAAAGLTVLVGLSGQISIGHGAFMLVGAYTTALMLKGSAGTHTPKLVWVLALSAVVAGLFGAVVGIAAARLRGPYLAGATLALAVGLPDIVNERHLSGRLGGSSGINVPPLVPAGGYDLYRWQALVCGIAAIVVLWVLANLSRSRVGRSLRAVRDDEVAASLSGLSVPRLQVLAFIISAACAGVGGGLLAVKSFDAGPGAFGLAVSLGLLAAVVFGGLGSLTGAVIGSALITLLPIWSQSLTDALSIHSDKISNNLPLMVYGVVLAVVMLVIPNGLMGAVRRGVMAVRSRRG
jgi:branched-chain amino acid transport system permease protein